MSRPIPSFSKQTIRDYHRPNCEACGSPLGTYSPFNPHPHVNGHCLCIKCAGLRIP